MWEYRLIWPAASPPWWDAAWQRGEAVLRRYGRSLEARPDTYLLIEGRPDVGLKLRGGAEEEFDIKAIHHRDRAWELWEKITFFRWNDLEAKRFAAILQRDLPLDDIAAATTPAQGARILLDAAAIESRLLTVAKRRMQARADELLPQFLGPTFSRSWLVELVEFRAEGADSPVRSICIETMSPLPGGEPLPPDGGLCAGYPEFLLRHFG